MLIAVVGATATGKSGFALDLGQALGGPNQFEMVGADAMQFYRGMDIGTAKLPVRQRRGFVHHLIDVLDIDDEATVAWYQVEARKQVDAICSTGKTPLVVGGSGLYLRALLDPIDFPGTDPNIRQRLENELGELGPLALHERLSALDPVSGERMDPRNGRRTVRALEVIEITGRPYSASLPEYRYVRPTVQIGLKLDLELLDDRIERRVDEMFELGLVDEVERLAKDGLGNARTARRATGYSQVLEMLEGTMTHAEARESIIVATRQLARRQIKWFRRDPRILWVDPTDHDSALERALERIESDLGDAKDSEPLL